MQPASAPPPPTPPPPPAAPRRSGGTLKAILGVLVLLALAFAGGYGPQWLRANRAEETLTMTNRELELANLHRKLGIATLEAQRNNFANATTAAAEFFEGCTRLAQRNPFPNRPRTQIAIGGYAQQRDAVMVQLAQADPQVAHRLAELYFTMDGVIARRE